MVPEVWLNIIGVISLECMWWGFCCAYTFLFVRQRSQRFSLFVYQLLCNQVVMESLHWGSKSGCQYFVICMSFVECCSAVLGRRKLAHVMNSSQQYLSTYSDVLIQTLHQTNCLAHIMLTQHLEEQKKWDWGLLKLRVFKSMIWWKYETSYGLEQSRLWLE